MLRNFPQDFPEKQVVKATVKIFMNYFIIFEEKFRHTLGRESSILIKFVIHKVYYVEN